MVQACVSHAVDVLQAGTDRRALPARRAFRHHRSAALDYKVGKKGRCLAGFFVAQIADSRVAASSSSSSNKSGRLHLAGFKKANK